MWRETLSAFLCSHAAPRVTAAKSREQVPSISGNQCSPRPGTPPVLTSSSPTCPPPLSYNTYPSLHRSLRCPCLRLSCQHCWTSATPSPPRPRHCHQLSPPPHPEVVPTAQPTSRTLDNPDSSPSPERHLSHTDGSEEMKHQLPHPTFQAPFCL